MEGDTVPRAASHRGPMSYERPGAGRESVFTRAFALGFALDLGLDLDLDLGSVFGFA